MVSLCIGDVVDRCKVSYWEETLHLDRVSRHVIPSVRPIDLPWQKMAGSRRTRSDSN
ncbi:unnamed protein product [Acidithrix sp. C25]|nr:unnamed protein product [Acidithrix sp. C25]